jgi:hypothetical protein
MGDFDTPALEMLRGIHAHFRANWAAIERGNPPGTAQYALNQKLMANLEDVIKLQDDIRAMQHDGQTASSQHLEDLQRQILEVSHNIQNVVAFASEIEGDSFEKPDGLDQLP